MTTLALDLGTCTGFAIRHNDHTVRSGAWEFKTDDRWRGLWSRIVRADVATPLRVLVIEKPVIYHGRPAGARVSFGLAAVAELFAQSHGIRFEEINLVTVKKSVTGNGHAKKDEMLEAVQKLFPDQRVVGYDHADALAVLYTFEAKR